MVREKIYESFLIECDINWNTLSWVIIGVKGLLFLLCTVQLHEFQNAHDLRFGI